MITKAEVQKLAELSRIAMSDKELATFEQEIDAILGYVGEVTALADTDGSNEKHELRNVMRDDVVTNEPGTYTKDIVAQFPAREGDALKVKKIL